ncbi:putative membrane protein [Microbacterium terrae]|uniref:DUF202 domain-containing protein n=1 Tax=Microbacterium terrae TaxID=69369 RepID=A0A0M2H8G8_9MICO|nr:DUF202 domain-containing protein [Microbacterium terrae]KJL40901.1 hypothetical protein RS81_01445 [Microbacterium terrae]MBP1078190.1 putative membrane protein [Microbacterium terrae]GLJ97669.1 hypothetical protein GCM10017594_08660 [Microbacterium terrae]
MRALFDPGLQPERTELAWRRTCLAFAIGSLVALRVLPAALDNAWWVLAGAAGLAASGALWLSASRRLSVVDTILARDCDRGGMPAGLLLALCLIALVAGVVSLAVVLGA